MIKREKKKRKKSLARVPLIKSNKFSDTTKTMKREICNSNWKPMTRISKLKCENDKRRKFEPLQTSIYEWCIVVLGAH